MKSVYLLLYGSTSKGINFLEYSLFLNLSWMIFFVHKTFGFMGETLFWQYCTMYMFSHLLCDNWLYVALQTLGTHGFNLFLSTSNTTLRPNSKTWVQTKTTFWDENILQSVLRGNSKNPRPASLSIFRVAKCHRYGRYIRVKILESWGKKCGRPHSFVKLSSFGVNSTNCYEVFKPLLFDRFSAFSSQK